MKIKFNQQIKIMKYVLGNGKVSITKGIVNDLDIPCITFGKLESQKKIGSDLMKSDELEHSVTTIYFKNLEGLKVLELMIKKVKKELKKQNKIIK